MQNQWVVFCLEALQAKKIFAEERLQVREGAKPLVRRRLSVRLGIAAIPIVGTAKGLIFFSCHRKEAKVDAVRGLETGPELRAGLPDLHGYRFVIRPDAPT